MNHGRLWTQVLGVNIDKSEGEIVKEDISEKKEGGIEKEESGNKGDKEEIGVIIDKIID